MATNNVLETRRWMEGERLEETHLSPADDGAVGKVKGELMEIHEKSEKTITTTPPSWNLKKPVFYLLAKEWVVKYFNTDYLDDEELDMVEESSSDCLDELLQLVDKRKEKKVIENHEHESAEQRIEREELESKWTQKHEFMYYEDRWNGMKRWVNKAVNFEEILQANGIPTPPIFCYKKGSSPIHINDNYQEPSTLPIFNAPSTSIVADYQLISIRDVRFYIYLVEAIENLKKDPIIDAPPATKVDFLREFCANIKYDGFYIDEEQVARLSTPLGITPEKIIEIMDYIYREKEVRRESTNNSQTNSEGSDSDASLEELEELEEPRIDEEPSTSGYSSNRTIRFGSETSQNSSNEADSEQATDTESEIDSLGGSTMEMDEGDGVNVFYCQSHKTPIQNDVPPPCWIYKKAACIVCAIELDVRRSSEKEWTELRLASYQSLMLDPISFCSPTPCELAVGTIMFQKYEVHHISSLIFAQISVAAMEGKRNCLSSRQLKLYKHISGEEVDDEKIRGFNLIKEGRKIQYFWKKDTEEDDAEPSIIDDKDPEGDEGLSEDNTRHHSEVKGYCQVFGTPITDPHLPACVVYGNNRSSICFSCLLECCVRLAGGLRSYFYGRVGINPGTFNGQEAVELEDGRLIGLWAIHKIPTKRFMWIKEQIQSGNFPQMSDVENELYKILDEQYDRRDRLVTCYTVDEGRKIQFAIWKSRVQHAAAACNNGYVVQSEKNQRNIRASDSCEQHDLPDLGLLLVKQRSLPRVQIMQPTRGNAPLQNARRIPRVRAAIPPSDRVLRPRAPKQAVPVVARPQRRRRNAANQSGNQVLRPRAPTRQSVPVVARPQRQRRQNAHRRNVGYRSGQRLTPAQVNEFLAQNTWEFRVVPLTQAQIDEALGRSRRGARAPRQPRSQGSTRQPRQRQRAVARQPNRPTLTRDQRAGQPQVLRRSERIRKQQFK